MLHLCLAQDERYCIPLSRRVGCIVSAMETAAREHIKEAFMDWSD